jgi:hypothetical protein
MSPRRPFLAILGGVALLAVACDRTPPPPAAPDAAKGDALLRQMSKSLGSAQQFSYATNEIRQRVRSNGEKVEARFSRHIIVRRPNRIVFRQSGGDQDGAAWYDGSHVTLVSNKNKVWARGPMPPTLDAAMDFISGEYAIQLATADLLYSSPYDALMTKDTVGGWVGTETIDGGVYDHLSYQQPVVDWQLWLTQDDRKLPKQIQLTYKTQPGQPFTRVTFTEWHPTEEVSDETFVAKVPDGYRRIRIMRHVTVSDGTLEGAPASPPAGQPASPASPK